MKNHSLNETPQWWLIVIYVPLPAIISETHLYELMAPAQYFNGRCDSLFPILLFYSLRCLGLRCFNFPFEEKKHICNDRDTPSGSHLLELAEHLSILNKISIATTFIINQSQRLTG